MRVLLFAILVITACRSKDRYSEALAMLDDPARREQGIELVYQRLRREGRISSGILPFGIGPLPARPGDDVLLDRLYKCLDDPRESVNSHARMILAGIRPPGHDERLLRCAVANPRAWQSCAEVLLAVGNEEAVRAYAAYIDVERSPDLPGAGSGVTYSFWKSGEPAIPYLGKYAAEGTTEGCANAMSSLEQLLLGYTADLAAVRKHSEARTRTLAALRRGIENPHWRCRRIAARLLATNDPESRVPLTELLDDPSPLVRDMADALLHGRDPDDPPDELDETTGARKPGDAK